MNFFLVFTGSDQEWIVFLEFKEWKKRFKGEGWLTVKEKRKRKNEERVEDWLIVNSHHLQDWLLNYLGPKDLDFLPQNTGEDSFFLVFWVFTVEFSREIRVKIDFDPQKYEGG